MTKLTRGYFYPDFYCDTDNNLEMPTAHELALIGYNNLYPIAAYLENAKATLQTGITNLVVEKAKATELLSKNENWFCDWWGAGRAKMPMVDEDVLMRKDLEAYWRQREWLRNQVFTCKMGRETAKWCNENLRHQACFKYENCLCSQPFNSEPCRLSTDADLAAASQAHLQELITRYEARLRLIKDYMGVIATVKATGEATRRPDFDLRPSSYLAKLSPGTRMISIWQSAKKRLVAKRGLYLGIASDVLERQFAYVRMIGGKIVEINLADNFDAKMVFLTEADFEVLRQNVEFREVWLELVNVDLEIGAWREFLSTDKINLK